MARKAQITFEMDRIEDDNPDLSWLENASRYDDCSPEEQEQYKAEDAERLANYGRTWRMIGIRAKATIKIPYGINPDCWILSTMYSPGLWGIESDSEESYFQSVYEEEKACLLGMLESLREFEVTEAEE